MLSPRFLRTQAEKCLRSALATTDLATLPPILRRWRVIYKTGRML
jgi:hypothetical protein